MSKLSMLYASPMWPMRSGISEYSKILLDGLDFYFDITLLIDNYKLSKNATNKKYKYRIYKKDDDYSKYDVILYNFGNNPDYHLYMYDMIQKYRGYIILHDVSLYYLTCEFYRQKNRLFNAIYKMEGIEGICKIKDSLKENMVNNLLYCKEVSSKILLNREILDRSIGVFLHSKYAANIVSQVKDYSKIHVINLVQPITERRQYNKLRKLFNLSRADYIVASFGYISETKQNHMICNIINKYNNSHNNKIHYVMVGEGNYVDHLLNDYIHKTGFVKNNEDFLDYIVDSNLIMNLRWPYNGESSATLYQCMSFGKKCIVTDIGAFSEIDSKAVIKVAYNIGEDNLYKILCEEVSTPNNIVAENAVKYVKENCSLEKISKDIFEVIINKG